MDVLRLLVFTEAWEGLLPAQSSHDEPAGVLRPESLHSASQVGLEHAVPSCRQTNQNRSQWHLCRISLPHMSLVQARCFLQVRRGGSLVTTWARDAGLHRSWQHLRHSALRLSVKSRSPLQQMPVEPLSRHSPHILAPSPGTCRPSPACLARGCLAMADLQTAPDVLSSRGFGAEFLARAGCNPSGTA